MNSPIRTPTIASPPASLIRTPIIGFRRAPVHSISADSIRTPIISAGRTLVAGALLLLAGIAQGKLSASVGWVSDYYYRGLLQHSSSASAGIDYSEGGFYAGAWGTDVGDGMEVDGYFGWSGESFQIN